MIETLWSIWDVLFVAFAVIGMLTTLLVLAMIASWLHDKWQDRDMLKTRFIVWRFNRRHKRFWFF